jgi:hypothetical protein
MNIKWYKKKKHYRRNKNSDCTITVTKSGNGTITIRNGFIDEISPATHYLTVGTDGNYPHHLFFMAKDEYTGWKATERTNKSGMKAYTVHVTDEELVHDLARFAGDYAFDLIDDNGEMHYCIDRRNVL